MDTRPLITAAAVAAGAAVGAYVAKWVPGGAFVQAIVGFALAWGAEAFASGAVRDVVLGVGAGIFVMSVPGLVLKVKR